jgi:2-desacetyl-2-hydroxyethyl bacteriochlorophyllide A dehydrogenase
MKAAVKVEPKPGIALMTVPQPQCGPNDVLLRIGAACICGTDLHIYDWDETGQETVKNLPVILGHELMGKIVDIGSKVKGWEIGKRVAVDPGITCGKCLGCRTGQFNLCDDRKTIGIHLNGGFAEYALANPNLLYELDDEITDEEGAFLENFGVAVHAVEKASLKPGDVAVVFGAGPVGLSTLICARAAGAKRIYVTEKNSPSRLEAAEEIGPDAVINVDKTDPVETILGLNSGQKVDVVFEVSGSPVALEQAVALTRKGGEIIAVGTPSTRSINVPLLELVLHEISLIGIRARTHLSWIRAIHLIKKVNVNPCIGPVMSLSDIEQAFKKSKNREVMKVIIKP